MGGTSDAAVESWRVALCRECHESLHAEEWRLRVEDGIAQGFVGEQQIFERAVALDDQSDDPRFWTDDRLCNEWWRAEDGALQCLQHQCAVAYWFWRRYGWAEGWYERAADMLTQSRGKRVDPARVYERIKLFLAFDGHWDDYDYLGKTLALAVAKSDEPQFALEEALSLRDAGHGIMKSVALLSGVSESANEFEVCPTCGGRGRIRKNG